MPNKHYLRMEARQQRMLQAVEDHCRNDSVSEDLKPMAKALEEGDRLRSTIISPGYDNIKCKVYLEGNPNLAVYAKLQWKGKSHADHAHLFHEEEEEIDDRKLARNQYRAIKRLLEIVVNHRCIPKPYFCQEIQFGTTEKKEVEPTIFATASGSSSMESTETTLTINTNNNNQTATTGGQEDENSSHHDDNVNNNNYNASVAVLVVMEWHEYMAFGAFVEPLGMQFVRGGQQALDRQALTEIASLLATLHATTRRDAFVLEHQQKQKQLHQRQQQRKQQQQPVTESFLQRNKPIHQFDELKEFLHELTSPWQLSHEAHEGGGASPRQNRLAVVADWMGREVCDTLVERSRENYIHDVDCITHGSPHLYNMLSDSNWEPTQAVEVVEASEHTVYDHTEHDRQAHNVTEVLSSISSRTIDSSLLMIGGWEHAGYGPIGRDLGLVFAWPYACALAHVLMDQKTKAVEILRSMEYAWDVYAARFKIADAQLQGQDDDEEEGLESRDADLNLNKYLCNVYRNCLGWAGWMCLDVFYMRGEYMGEGFFVLELPVNSKEYPLMQRKMLCQTIGACGLKLMKYGFGGEEPKASINVLMSRLKRILMEEARLFKLDFARYTKEQDETKPKTPSPLPSPQKQQYRIPAPQGTSPRSQARKTSHAATIRKTRKNVAQAGRVFRGAGRTCPTKPTGPARGSFIERTMLSDIDSVPL